MQVNVKDGRVPAWRGMARAHAHVARRLDEALQAGAGLALTDVEALEAIARAPGGRARISALGRVAALTPSGASRCVDRLARAGLVVREACPEDRRGQLAAITGAGRARLDEALAIRDEVLSGVLGELFAEDELATMAAWAGRFEG